MKIITYTAPDDAPASLRYAAAMLLDGQATPLWWTAAASPEEARSRLTALYEREKAHYAAREGLPAPKRKPRAVADPGDVI